MSAPRRTVTMEPITKLPFVTIRAKCAQCGAARGGFRFRALCDVPVQTYDRFCKFCGTKWRVRREFDSSGKFCRIDVLVWESV